MQLVNGSAVADVSTGGAANACVSVCVCTCAQTGVDRKRSYRKTVAWLGVMKASGEGEPPNKYCLRGGTPPTSCQVNDMRNVAAASGQFYTL